jgi:hypothetical protein
LELKPHSLLGIRRRDVMVRRLERAVFLIAVCTIVRSFGIFAWKATHFVPTFEGISETLPQD